jgi:O-antigen ligase
MSAGATIQNPAGPSSQRRALELAFALIAATVTGLGFALLGGIAVKYQIAAVAGLLVGGAVMMHPDRRLLFVILWVMVMPLGMEKVIDSGLSIGPEFSTQYIVINAADVFLLLLGMVLLFEWLKTGTCPLVWSSLATAWTAILLWSFASYAIHGYYLRDGLVHVAPLSLLTGVRVLIFFVLLQSSIRDRGELITVLVALGLTLFLQSLVVMASYATGETFNLVRLLGGPQIKLNTFGDGAAVTRATGTVGYINQQAAYHAFCTIPLAALLALKNAAFRQATLGVICLSYLAIILTFSRGAWLASAVALLQVLFVFAKRRQITPGAWLKGGILALAACCVVGALSYPIMERLGKGGDDGATNSRLRMIALAFDLFEEHPLIGVGPGEYVEAGYRLEPINDRVPEWVAPGGVPTVPGVGRLETAQAVATNGAFVKVPLSVHNRYLLSLSETGIPGLMLWLILFGLMVRHPWRCARSEDPFYRFFGIAGTGMITGLLLYLNSDMFADDKTFQIVFFIPVLLCIADRHLRSRPRTATAAHFGPAAGRSFGGLDHRIA